MAKPIEHEVAYYYDSNPIEEDEVPESMQHADLVRYLTLVLAWLMRGQLCTICENLGFYHTFIPKEKPVAPDIAVVKGVALQGVRSWKVGITGPAPQVVFEIASEETWVKDLDEKPAKYALMGVEEYFAYDPNEHLVRKGTTRRLYGWQLDKTTGQMEPIPVGPDGRLWSTQLECFLVPDGQLLRLYDRQGQMCLTEAQAETKAKLAEKRRADALAEKLRSLGIDPDQI